MQVEELRSRLTGAETLDAQEKAAPTKSECWRPDAISGSPAAPPEKVQRDAAKGTQRSEPNVSNGVTVCLWSLQSSENPLSNPRLAPTGFPFLFHRRL